MHACDRTVHALGAALLATCMGLVCPAARAATVAFAYTGDSAPGTPPGVTFAGFGAPTLGRDGTPLFSATVAGPGIGATNATGLWQGTTRIVQRGGRAPGTPAGVLLSSIASTVPSAAGIAYRGLMTGPGVNTGNDAGLWRGQNLLAREGSAAPGAGAGTLFDVLSSPVVSAGGQVAYRASLRAGTATANTNAGLWRGAVLVAREGGAAGAGNGVVFASFFDPDVNDAGQIAFRGTVRGTGVTTSNESGLWRNTTLVAREGASAGAGAGVVFAGFSDPAIAKTGLVAYRATLRGTGVTANNDTGLWRNGALLAREGGAAGGTGAGVSYAAFFNPEVTDAGAVIYRAALRGTGVTSANDVGLWRNTTLLAREGGAAPEGATFGVLFDPAVSGNGLVAFEAELAAEPVASDRGLYLTDGIDMLEVVREGAALDAGVVTGIEFRGGRNAYSVNDAGQVGYTATLDDGSETVVVYTPTLAWRAAGNGDWGQSANWTLGLNPGAVHDVVLGSAADLRVNGPVANTTLAGLTVGTGDGATTLALRGATLAATGGIDVEANGTVTGAGTLAGTVTNHGTLAPGNSPGILSIDGDLLLGDDGQVLMEIAGLVAGTQHDRIDVSGVLQLGGTLAITFLDGWLPSVGDAYTLFLAGEIAGEIGTLVVPQVTGLQFVLENGGDALRLLAVSAVPLPAAAWLFASALPLVLARARRRVTAPR